jgi:tRNA dimethylallyltransferase
MEPGSSQPPLVVVVGETASGKSSLAIDLARRFDGEIICADSWTVRREVNIGTAKPTRKEQAEIPHHLLDVVGPCEDFTAAVFKRLANRAISEIHARRKLPIMVGGTGLYVDSVLFDYSFLPPAEKSQRDELNSKTIQQLLLLINQRNLSLEGVDIRNKRRLIRVIESRGARPARQVLRPNTLIVGIALSRELLEQRIAERVNAMLSAGLEKEVKVLAQKYGWDCEALKGIGYQEWKAYLEGAQSMNETKARIIKDTLGLAKRQRTWFKRNRSIHWISNAEEAVDLATTFLNK